MTTLRLRDAYTSQVTATIPGWSGPLPRPGDKLRWKGRNFLAEPEAVTFDVEGDDRSPDVVITLIVRLWTTADPAKENGEKK